MTFCQQQHTADLNEVCGWLGVACPDDIRTEFVTRPTADFISQIKEMLNTYDEFPEDARRTQRIINAIRSGKPAQPVYIEQGDHDLFRLCSAKLLQRLLLLSPMHNVLVMQTI